MINQLILIGIIFVITGTLVFIAIQWGKSKEKAKAAKIAAKISRQMTKAVVNAPKTKEELLEKLRKSGL